MGHYSQHDAIYNSCMNIEIVPILLNYVHHAFHLKAFKSDDTLSVHSFTFSEFISKLCTIYLSNTNVYIIIYFFFQFMQYLRNKIEQNYLKSNEGRYIGVIWWKERTFSVIQLSS